VSFSACHIPVFSFGIVYSVEQKEQRQTQAQTQERINFGGKERRKMSQFIACEIG
jgi:hypothetical protein